MPKNIVVRKAQQMPLRKNNKVPVIGGDRPTGKLPRIIGAGIFGYPGAEAGIFSDGRPLQESGIFFNPYATSNLSLQRPDNAWALRRRPGQPLYPGSSARGIVLVGPTMGSDGSSTETSTACKACFVLALGALAYLGYKSYQKRPEMYQEFGRKAAGQAKKINIKRLSQAKASLNKKIKNLNRKYSRGEITARAYKKVANELALLKEELDQRALAARR
jgi:hypothetical protein